MQIDFKKHRPGLLHFAGILLAVLTIWSAYRVLRQAAGNVAGDFFSPYLSVAAGSRELVADASLLACSRSELASKIEFLQRENRRLAAQAALAGSLQVENESLRRLLTLSSGSEWSYVAAEIILRDPWFWNESVTVNKGSNDGITPGSAALSVTADGRLLFAGVVRHAGKNTSRIETVYNPELKVSAAMPISDSTGILNPNGEKSEKPGVVEIGFLPAKKSYTDEEAVQTSGFEKNIPPGIKIGNLKVKDGRNAIFSNRLFFAGEVTPAVEMNKVRFLIIAVKKEHESR